MYSFHTISPTPSPGPGSPPAALCSPEFLSLGPLYLSEILPRLSQKGGLECGSYLDVCGHGRGHGGQLCRRGPGSELWAEESGGKEHVFVRGKRQ